MSPSSMLTRAILPVSRIIRSGRKFRIMPTPAGVASVISDRTLSPHVRAGLDRGPVDPEVLALPDDHVDHVDVVPAEQCRVVSGGPLRAEPGRGLLRLVQLGVAARDQLAAGV